MSQPDQAGRPVDITFHTIQIRAIIYLTKGTYISVEPFHLFRRLDEQAFRYNNRGNKENPINDEDRFGLALSQIAGKRLTFAELTGKVGAAESN
jgi:hypothetical protein